MAQGAAGIGGRAKVEVVDPHVGCELEAALGRQALVMPAEATVAQASASWLSGGLFQRQIVLQAAPSSRLPRASASLGQSAAGSALASGPVFDT